MIDPIGQSPLPYSQYDMETWALQQRWLPMDPKIIDSHLPTLFEVVKAQESQRARKKNRAKKNQKNPSQEDNK